eukprot:CAMPEP_0115006534 /NCGR_PEP_ID=MMETSP0216-20121206/20565_1 /TAXON_ID=223996 /ORGANISM="Protocruzia adherens, Strain Boccale" /LENGTH=154 /DNA_ID=CAMNT_0002373151 /DNA_START=206 /DNA_END=670 /DNA_ORIENTATION=+
MSSVQIITPIEFNAHNLEKFSSIEMENAHTTEGPVFRDASPEIYSPFRRSYRKKSTKLSVFSLDAPEGEESLKPCDSTRADSVIDSFTDDSDDDEAEDEIAKILAGEDSDDEEEEDDDDNTIFRNVHMIPSRCNSNGINRDAYFSKALQAGRFE